MFYWILNTDSLHCCADFGKAIQKIQCLTQIYQDSQEVPGFDKSEHICSLLCCTEESHCESLRAASRERVVLGSTGWKKNGTLDLQKTMRPWILKKDGTLDLQKTMGPVGF